MSTFILRSIVVISFIVALAGCGSSSSSEESNLVDGSLYDAEEADVAFRASDEADDDSYASDEDDVDSRADAEQEVRSLKGYSCTDDCSGHEAGYEWAEKNGITNPGDCGGNSNSFVEGCEAYAEEQ